LQGFLKDANGKAVADSKNFAVTFKLYTTLTGGTAAWTENQTVDVSGGVYSAQLGKVTSLENLSWGTNTYYVGVTIDGVELTPRTELTFAPYSLGSPSADKATTVICSGAVGDIKHSILNPTQFALVNGDCWVPMDGRNIAGSKLATTFSITNLPDGGGMFLRAQEFSNSGNNDPDRDSNSPIASFQEQSFASHNHGNNFSISSVGDHSHNVAFRFNTLSVNAMTGFVPDTHSLNNNSTNVKFAAEDRLDANITSAKNFGTGGDGGHSHTLSGGISNTGSIETRPKNLNFWVYIRIN
jgi:hypothetical protein